MVDARDLRAANLCGRLGSPGRLVLASAELGGEQVKLQVFSQHDERRGLPSHVETRLSVRAVREIVRQELD